MRVRKHNEEERKRSTVKARGTMKMKGRGDTKGEEAHLE